MNLKPYYHFTTAPLEILEAQGIQPYPLDKPHQRDVAIYLAELGRVASGIWLWCDKPDDRTLRQAILWQAYQKDIFTGTLLEVELNPEDLFHYQIQRRYPKRNVEITHTLRVGGELLHELEFDLYLDPIYQFKPVAQVSFEFKIERF